MSPIPDSFGVSEVMLCSFTDGMQVASLSNLEDEQLYLHHGYSIVLASKWHDHFPGETRFQLDLTHLISLYDVALAPSLVAGRVGQDRRAHRVLGIDERDTETVNERVQAIPSSPSESGIDWRTQFQVVRDRYARRIELLQYTLNSTGEAEFGQRAFHQLQMLLMSYRLRSATPPPAGWDTAWAAPVFQLCTRAYVSFIESVEDTLTASEQLLLKSAQETTREMCRTLTKMWAEGMLELVDSTTISSSLALAWKSDVDRLVDWLGWADLWLKCRPACAFDVRDFGTVLMCSHFLRRSPATFLAGRSPWKSGIRRYPAVFGLSNPTLALMTGFSRLIPRQHLRLGFRPAGLYMYWW
jgi:hypothetical protein